MKNNLIHFFLIISCISLASCLPKRVSASESQDGMTIPDTSYHYELCYLFSLTRYNPYLAPRNNVDSIFLESCLSDENMQNVKVDTRLKVIRLLRLAKIETGYSDKIVVQSYYRRDGIVDRALIHSYAILGRVPIDYITAFDSLKEIIMPMCPSDVREVIKKLDKLETLNVNLLSDKPCTLDLSGLDMKNLKALYVSGPSCTQIIFPEKNKIEVLVLDECNITEFDDSFKNLKKLRRIRLCNIPLQNINVNGMTQLDSISIKLAKESPPKKILLRKIADSLLVDFGFSVGHSYWGLVERDSAATNEPYKLHAAAMKCDCE